MTLYDSRSYPPLPSQPEPTLSARIAEAKRLRGKVPEWQLNKILTVIQGSARDCAAFEIKVSDAPKIVTIQTIVAKHFNLTVGEMISKSRLQRNVRPRMIAIYLARILTSRSFNELGQKFGARDHTTVMHSVRKIAGLVAVDMVFAEEIEALKKMVVS